jgi:hypothetical protein
MATKPDSDLKTLQDRVTELEKQLQKLRLRVNGTAPPQRRPNRLRTEEGEIAFHEASQRVAEFIRKERERDLKRVNAAIDRQVEREKKAAARQGRGKARPKARKAG